MLTRTAAHYPNSGHTKNTLAIVAEDWFDTFYSRLTDRAFIDAVTVARRKGRFFPTEKDVFEAAGIPPDIDCGKCQYGRRGTCDNKTKKGFEVGRCQSYVEVK